MTPGEQLAAALATDPTTAEWMGGLTPEVQASLQTHWAMTIDAELQTLAPSLYPEPAGN
jgi:hypothetical protein